MQVPHGVFQTTGPSKLRGPYHVRSIGKFFLFASAPFASGPTPTHEFPQVGANWCMYIASVNNLPFSFSFPQQCQPELFTISEGGSFSDWSMGKKRLPSSVLNAEALIVDGVQMLGMGAVEEGLRLLDLGSGFRTGTRGMRGSTLSADMGLRCLPEYIVRRVEYESTLRKFNRSEMEIGIVHAEFEDSWYYGDVSDKELASEYLMRAMAVGNMFAGKVLEWLDPERGREGRGGKEEWLKAIERGDRQRAVELGRVVGGGGNVRPDCTVVMRMDGREQRAVSANNIGFMLANGKGGVTRNVEEAVRYYDMGIEWGSGPAASNKGFLLHYGAGGLVRKDGEGARMLYELAIERGERNHAPRNLGLLYWAGGGGMRRDVGKAARWLLVGLQEGDEEAKMRCEISLKRVLRSWRLALYQPALKAECMAALDMRKVEAAKLHDYVQAETVLPW